MTERDISGDVLILGEVLKIALTDALEWISQINADRFQREIQR